MFVVFFGKWILKNMPGNVSGMQLWAMQCLLKKKRTALKLRLKRLSVDTLFTTETFLIAIGYSRVSLMAATVFTTQRFVSSVSFRTTTIKAPV